MREEAIMKICNSADLERHRESHQKLLTSASLQIEELQNSYSPESLRAFSKFLNNWLFDHIIKEDTQISWYTEGKEHLIQKALDAIVYDDMDPAPKDITTAVIAGL